MKILLLEDDTLLHEIIEEFLEELEHDLVSTYDGQEAYELIFEQHFDLLILDVNVPSINGFDLLKSLKKQSLDIPTIFITSLHTTKDMEIGFRAGADDYIRKPFVLSELKLRIDNVKRLRKIDSRETYKINDLISYDFETKTIEIKDKKTNLSKTESKVFEYLLKNCNKAVSIEEIALNNWVYDDAPTDTTIRTYIKNLRKILGKDAITNIKGIGYKLDI